MTSAETRLALTPAPMPATAATAQWRGHVVVCGLNDEALRVVEQLVQAEVAAVVVDDVTDQRLLRALGRAGVPHLSADPRATDTLHAAGLKGAAAVICIEDDDLQTLAVALLARELRPDVRVVVQLGNAAVGRALEDVGVAVLDVAGLAAPSIVEACLQTRTRTLRLGDTDWVVAEGVSGRAGTLRELYGDLAPLAVVPAGQSDVDVAPGRDRVIEIGDTVVVVGPPAEIAAAGLDERARAAPRQAFVGARAPRIDAEPRPTTLVRYLIRTVDRRVQWALLALFSLAFVSVGLLMVGYREPGGRRMSVVDAVYFTVETVGTVGYGDFYFRDQATWLRVWAILLMVVGAILAATFFALLTNLLISQTIRDTLGQRRVTGLKNHVVVLGLGSVGVAVVDLLRARDIEVVVVDADEDNRFRSRMRADRVPVVIADSTEPDTLRAVRLADARAVAVTTSDDLVNIETGLAVRDLLGDRWGAVPVPLRIFDRRLARTVQGSFDFRYVRSPAALAAPWFVGAALGLEVLSTFYVGHQLLLVARLVVTDGGGLDGRAMHQLSARIRVVSLVRRDGAAVRPPRRDTRFEAGDVAHLIGPYEELLSLLREDAPG